MNVNKAISLLATLRVRLEGALRTADTSGLQSAPADIDTIVAVLEGKQEPTTMTGEKWEPNVGGDATTTTPAPTTTPEATTTAAPTTTPEPTTTKPAKVDAAKSKS